MSATPQDVQAKLDDAVTALELTTVGYRNKNWKTPPAGSQWAVGLAAIAAARAEAGQLVPPTAPAPAPSSGSYDDVVPALTYPVVTLARHIVCTSRSQHDAAVANLQPGDWVDCQAVTFVGEVVYAKQLAGPAKITYDAGCAFTGTAAGSALPALWAKNCDYLQFIFNGCPVSNIGGDGILHSGGHHCVFDGYTVHDVGRQGVFAGPTVAPIHDCFYRGEAYKIGLNHSMDLHAEKGTGLHCFLAADTDMFPFYGNTVAMYGHDCAYSGGCVVQLGDNTVAPYGNTVYVKAENMLMQALSQVAGNAINLWGLLHDHDLRIVEASNMMGRAVDAGGVYPATVTNVKVARGRAAGCCQNPSLASQSPWDPRHGVTYSADVLTA